MKIALITGGSSPIGLAVCKELAGNGFHVIVHTHSNIEKATACVEDIRSNGGSGEVLVLDLLDAGAFAELESLAIRTPIQVLVHCVGGQRDKPFAAMEFDEWQDVIDLNLTSFFTTLRPIIIPMMRTRWGRVIAISSLSATLGNRGQSNYAAAKGALLPLIKSLSQEYGSRGITANVVTPGLIDTPETKALKNYDALVSLSASGRAGLVQDVADLVGFLASDKAGYISGQHIAVDGGAS